MSKIRTVRPRTRSTSQLRSNQGSCDSTKGKRTHRKRPRGAAAGRASLRSQFAGKGPELCRALQWPHCGHHQAGIAGLPSLGETRISHPCAGGRKRKTRRVLAPVARCFCPSQKERTGWKGGEVDPPNFEEVWLEQARSRNELTPCGRAPGHHTANQSFRPRSLRRSRRSRRCRCPRASEAPPCRCAAARSGRRSRSGSSASGSGGSAAGTSTPR